MGTGGDSIDAQPELFQMETQPSRHEQLKGHVAFLSAGGNHVDNSEIDSGRMSKTLRFAPLAVRKILRWSFNDIIHACM
ncbi:hypothetical protein BRADI_3g57653v3 [Brachypodium distachyon]|uniref:Uncharacterized protein n=1 Tax=Brachypodium distachyon TaxID=15368 RepID=A0A0Q3INB5_BRADI|nr:hypothetical protein BRADI_3g57653v3 [Brachypodium distachyon]